MKLRKVFEAGKTLWYRFRGDCVFCKIIEGEAESQIVYEDEGVVAFAPLESGVLSEGHLLVVPKNHYENIFDIPVEELKGLMEEVKEISEKLRRDAGFDGVNLLNASGESAQQSVNHFHIHLVPRKDGEDRDLWPETGYEEDSYREVYEYLDSVL